MKHGVLSTRDNSRDPAMARSIVEDSSTGRSTQPAMSGNTRELANSLVEMKIALGDIPMADARASQGEDNQQPPREAVLSRNPNPVSIFPEQVWEDVHVDPMNVDALPTDPPADAGDEADNVEDHPVQARFQVKFQTEAPLAEGGDAQQEQSNPSSGDRPMGEVQEDAPLTGEGDAKQEHNDLSSEDPSISEDDEKAPLTGDGALQKEQCDPSSGDHPMTDARPIHPVDIGITEGPSIPSPAAVTAIIPFLAPPPTTQPEETPQSTAHPTRMNDEVVDDAMRDLDPMSPPPKDLVLCPQPLAVREVIDLDLVHGDSNVHGGDSNLNDLDVNVGDDPLPQRGKGKARLRRSFDASFDVGAALVPPNTRSKGKDRGNHAELV